MDPIKMNVIRRQSSDTVSVCEGMKDVKSNGSTQNECDDFNSVPCPLKCMARDRNWDTVAHHPSRPTRLLPPFPLSVRGRPGALALQRPQPTNQDWRALQHVSQEMKGDRELCTAAVALDGLVLEFVAEDMQGHREVWVAGLAAMTN